MRIRVKRTLGSVAAAVLTSAAACPADSVVSNCSVSHTFTVPGSFTVETPVRCPLYIGSRGQHVNFGGYVRVEAISTGGDITVFNFGQEVKAYSGLSLVVDWNDPNNGYDDESAGPFYLDYPAATYPIGDHYDRGEVRIHLLAQPTQYAEAFLTYYTLSPIQIAGPVNLLPYQDFTVSASFHDPSLSLPISKQWTLNGQILPDTGWMIQGNSGHMGTQFEYVLTVTGADGQSRSNFHRFYTKLCDFEGCNDM